MVRRMSSAVETGDGREVFICLCIDILLVLILGVCFDEGLLVQGAAGRCRRVAGRLLGNFSGRSDGCLFQTAILLFQYLSKSKLFENQNVETNGS